MMTDYTDMAFESMIEEMEVENLLNRQRILAESKFLLSSLEEGRIVEYVEEADLKGLKNKAGGALKVFLDKVNGAFIAAAAKFYESYADYVKDKAETIKQRAQKKEDGITLAPYNKPNYEADLSVVKKVIDDAFKYPYNEDDIDFIKSVLPSINGKSNYTLDDYTEYKSGNSGAISTMLKNRFRFGVAEPDNNNIKKDTVKGGDLVARVDQMVKYVLAYKQFASNVRKISEEWKNKAKTFKSQVSETLELSQDMYSILEETSLRYTDLALLEGFDLLPMLEVDGADGQSQKNADDNKGTGDEQKNDVTKVEDNSKENDKDNGENGDDKKKPKSPQRYNLSNDFCKLVYTSYLFSVEERFVVYIKALEMIYGSSLKSKDDSGTKKDTEQQ